MSQSDYAFLGLPDGSSPAEVHRAWRKLALRYHPDRNKAPDAAERFGKISEAYRRLSAEFFKSSIRRAKIRPRDRRYRIEVDWDSCVGSGSCTILAPNTFRLDETRWKSFASTAPLEVDEESVDDDESVFLAAQSCPFKAILLYDAKTGRRVFP